MAAGKLVRVVARKKYNRYRKKRSLGYKNTSRVFKQSLKVCLPYHALENYGLGALGVFDYRFNLNSIFDPDNTGGGHQPLGHDQWNAFYGRYRVDKVKVTATLAIAGNNGAILCLVANNSAVAISNINTAIEQPSATYKTLSPGGDALVITRTYDLSKIASPSNMMYKDDDRYQSTFGASPSEAVILHVIIADNNLQDVTVRMNVQMLMYTTMFDAVTLTQS